MLALLWPLLAKIAFNLLIAAAEKSGILNTLEASAIRAEHDAVSAVQHLKTSSNPEDFPDSPPPLNSNRNFNKS